MEIVTSHSNMKKYCSSVTALLIMLIGKCQAHENTQVPIVIPIALISSAFIIMCVCFWTCVCIRWISRMPYHTIPTTTHHPVYPPWQRQRQPHTRTPRTYYPTQWCPQQHTAPNVQPPKTPPYRSQDYIPAPYTSTRIAPCAPQPEAIKSQTVQRSGRPEFLPEAVLHHGEAPPEYEEVVRKKITATV